MLCDGCLRTHVERAGTKGLTSRPLSRRSISQSLFGKQRFPALALFFPVYDQCQPLEHPPLEDWLELLDAVQRRTARRLLRPDEPARLKKIIRELFPEAELP